MKTTRFLLGLSLAANAVLLFAVWWTRDGTPLSAAKPAVVAVAPAVKSRDVAVPEGAPDPAAAKLICQLGMQDLTSLVASLRAAGFPEAVIRAIVRQRLELRREQLTHDDLDPPYWKNVPTEADDPKQAELERLRREQGTLWQQLFGDEALADDEEAAAYRFLQYGTLPANKVAAIGAIQSRHAQELQDLFTGMRRDVPSPELMEKTTAITERIHAEIAQALTPDELLEFDLRNSPTAARLRFALTGFNPSEAEYRSLFQLYQAYDAAHPSLRAPATPEEAAAYAAAQRQLDEQIKALLPPDRYADYRQASRPEFQPINALVAKLELPPSSAAEVISVQQDILQRAATVRGNPSLSNDDRTAQLAALGDEAKTRITRAIGARGLEGFRQSGGQWLDQLAPRPAATPRKKGK